MRSFFSTSISRRPLVEYLFSSPLTIEDLPVPRAPVRSTLFAGLPSRNCLVFCSTLALGAPMPRRSESLMRCTWRTGCNQPAAPRRPALRQRKATLAFQSVAGGGGGSSVSSRCRIFSSSLLKSRLCASRPVFGVDFHVVKREVASPHRSIRLAPAEHHPHREFRLLHHRHALLVLVGGMPSTSRSDEHLVEIKAQL